MAKKKQTALRLGSKQQEAVISEVAGEDVLDVVAYLRGKENTSEFVIAQDLEQEIHQVRNKLYRLLHHNLIGFHRKKDKQKGWYIYYWTLNLGQTKFLYFDLKRQRLDKLKDRLGREKDVVYFSGPSKAIRLDFDQALGFDFRCPETGEVLEQEDNSATIKGIEKEIKDLEKEVKELEGMRK